MANEYGPFKDKANPDNEWTIRGCVIRFEPGTVHSNGTFSSGGPYIHANSGHIAVGVQGVHVEADGDLVVDLDGGPISMILVSSDETLASRGIFYGPSGAAGTTTLRFYKVGIGRLYLNQQAHWDALSATIANGWFGWFTCTTRGEGLPSKADRALAQLVEQQVAIVAHTAVIGDLAGRVAHLAGRVARLESLQTPGSIGRFDQAKTGQTLGQVNTDHAGDTFGDFDTAYADV